MADFNRIILKGRLGSDPEVKDLKFGTIVEMPLATSESWKDKESGEWKNNSTWHKIVCKGDYATKYSSKYLKKGMNVMVEGKQENRTYEVEGKKRVSPEVIVGPFGGSISSTDPKVKEEVKPSEPKQDSGSLDLDDEIPF